MSPPDQGTPEAIPSITTGLAGTERQPHAAALLTPAASPGGTPSHAYLFHGPPGSGKRTVARAFASALLSQGAPHPEQVQARVARGAHPDLTWVRPTGAAEMLVADIDQPVVAAATRTPFEASRRVFVIEAADTMNPRAANRMLKTLEDPPAFVHIVLLAARSSDVLPTIVSRCQLVRFDPLPPQEIERRLLDSGADPTAAAACARLCLGDMHLAKLLSSELGLALRAAAEALAEAAFADAPLAASRPWAALLDASQQAGELGGREVAEQAREDLELLSASERRRREREATEAGRRAERRRRTEALQVGLSLVELWLRDLLCLTAGAPEILHAVDRAERLRPYGDRASQRDLSAAIHAASQTSVSLVRNVSPEIALEALAYRLQALLAS